MKMFILVFICLICHQALAACTGTSVSACSSIKDQDMCSSYYLPNKKGGNGCVTMPPSHGEPPYTSCAVQCKWGTSCTDAGEEC